MQLLTDHILIRLKRCLDLDLVVTADNQLKFDRNISLSRAKVDFVLSKFLSEKTLLSLSLNLDIVI